MGVVGGIYSLASLPEGLCRFRHCKKADSFGSFLLKKRTEYHLSITQKVCKVINP
jgi:hypothetical protein